MSIITIILRWLVEACLLLLVWQHSHWSVALVVTLLGIANEFQNTLNNKLINNLKI